MNARNYGKMFEDPVQPMDARVADLMRRLTREEKISLLSETAPAIERLGIKAYNHGNEGLHGVVRPGRFTVFPRPTGLAATFNPALVHEMAVCIGDEARARHNELGGALDGEASRGKLGNRFNGLLTLWSPNVNMVRDPRWGRVGETYGEDPFLTGVMGAAFVSGLQGDDDRYLKTIATPKHYTANNEEHNRFECKADIPERWLREYYLPAFRRCVTEGKAASIMAAYNAVNGVPCSANKMLLSDILRDEWGFDGYVVGDMWSPAFVFKRHRYRETLEEAAAACLDAGLDLDSAFQLFPALPAAFEKELCAEKDLDRALARVLRGRFRLGLFDPPGSVPYDRIPPDVVGCSKHHALALRLGRESIVLLKNDPPAGKPERMLPLDAATCGHVAAVGPNMHTWRHTTYSCEKGSVHAPVTPLQGLKELLGDGRVSAVPWLPSSQELSIIESPFLMPAAGAGTGLCGEYYSDRSGSRKAAERLDAVVAFDRRILPDPLFGESPLGVRWTGFMQPPRSGTYTLAVESDGGFELSVDGSVVLATREKGEVRVWRCDIDLTADVPVSLCLTYLDGDDSPAVIGLKWRIPAGEVFPGRQAEALKAAECVVAFMGLNERYTDEGRDRMCLDLPAEQQAYLEALYSINSRIILVLLNGEPLAINWAAEVCPAIVEAWFPGECAGTVIADVLFGRYNPAGRLPMTIYKSTDQLPPFDDYDISKGRTYMFLDDEPLYPFGHGLSYTTFAYGAISARQVDDAVVAYSVGLDVTNTGDREGDEVVMVYARHEGWPEPAPKCKLVAFNRVFIPAGETVHVELPVHAQDLMSWSVQDQCWHMHEGVITFFVGEHCVIPVRDEPKWNRQ